MLYKKNIKVGKNKFFIFLILIQFIVFSLSSNSENELEGKFTDIQVLDKISSKNILLKLKNSEFDDNPEIIAYIQVKDITKKSNDDVFVFNEWMFSSSPSIAPFDHPVYDIWLVDCY